MDNQQAKFILQCYRQGSSDRSDPHFAAALELAAQDPALAAWLADDQACDEILRRKLSEVEVPADLRTNLILGQHAVPLPQPNTTWKTLAWAASLVFLLGVGAIWWTFSGGAAPLTMTDYEVRMVDKLYRPISFNFASSDAAVIQAWLQTNSALGELTIPARMSGLPSIGCETLSIEGRPVAIICFRVSQDEVVHLFVMSAAGLEDVSSVAESRKSGAFRTLSWREGDNVYVLAGRQNESSLRRLIEG